MKKRFIRNVTLFIVAIVLLGVVLLLGEKSDIGVCMEYSCDVKLQPLSTIIEIEKSGNYFATVKGNIIKIVTDPLSMYDTEKNKTAYADDSYHMISQDSHAIYVDDEQTAEMVGLVSFIGDAYDIYDSNGIKIANVKFNSLNTNGKMYDMDGNLIADYNSQIYRRDFDVRIKDTCKIDEKTVLMIFCSYYSDRAYDSSK